MTRSRSGFTSSARWRPCTFDLTVISSGRTLKEVAQFEEERLSTLEDVTGTATHFILHKYKEKHLIFEKQEQQEKEWIFS